MPIIVVPSSRQGIDDNTEQNVEILDVPNGYRDELGRIVHAMAHPFGNGIRIQKLDL
jgi:hypothetical protein